MMAFPVSVTDISIRAAEIASKAGASSVERQAFYLLNNRKEMLPIVRVPIDLPVYRMANYRTQTAQLKYVRDNPGTPPDFFKTGEENVDAQRAQHSLLLEFAKKGSGDTIVPVFDALKEGQQTQPLLVTATGVVVNGNRRLAAMRELYASDGSAFASYGHVDLMVLPETARTDEVRIIEVSLQMTPQTLLPYEWVDEALALRELRDVHGLTIDEIARHKRLDKPSDVNKMIQQLEYAEDYLATYIRQPDVYELVSEKKQQFQDIQKLLNGRTGPALDRARQIAYVLTKNSQKLGRRAYDYNAAFGRYSDDVVSRLHNQYERESPLPEQGAPEPSRDEDVFDELEGAENDEFSELIPILSDLDRSEELALSIKTIVDQLRDEESEQNRGEAALRHAVRANTELSEIDLSAASPATLRTIESQLENCVAQAKRLLSIVLEAKARG